MSKAQVGKGTAFSIGGITGAGGSESFTALGEVRDSKPSGAEWGLDDVTHLLSVRKEKIATIIDPGTEALTITRIPNDAGQLLLEAAFIAGVAYDFKKVLPINTAAGQATQGDTYVYSAIVVSKPFATSVDKAFALDVKLQITGAGSSTSGS